jgi:cold shock CspA family protein
VVQWQVPALEKTAKAGGVLSTRGRQIPIQTGYKTVLGKVKSYARTKGYGFLNTIGPDRANIPGDVFFNISQALVSGNEIKEDMLVEFDLGKDRIGRRCAVQIRLPGTAVEPKPDVVRQDPRRRVAEQVFKRQ